MRWDRVLSDGKIFTSQQSGKSRRYVYYRGKNYKYSIVLWNVAHPRNLVRHGEVVHHKDLNTMNDAMDNFDKLTVSRHMMIHNASAYNPFLGKKHSKRTRALMSKIAKETGRKPPSRKGIRQMKWDFDGAVNLRKGGATWVSLGKKYQVTPEAVQAAFRRRGLQ